MDHETPISGHSQAAWCPHQQGTAVSAVEVPSLLSRSPLLSLRPMPTITNTLSTVEVLERRLEGQSLSGNKQKLSLLLLVVFLLVLVILWSLLSLLSQLVAVVATEVVLVFFFCVCYCG